MRYTLGFGLTAAVAALGAIALGWWPARLLLLWIAVSFGLASAGYAGLGPGILGKRADGRLPAWSLALNGPFLLLGLVAMRLVHWTSTDAAFHEIAPGLWLGRRPHRNDRAEVARIGFRAVLDLTAELPASGALTGRERYLTLPVLDADAPTGDQLDLAVDWLDGALREGPVLVHCALGHSRSATVVAAWRLRHGADGDALAVETELRRTRPGVRLTPAQHVALDRWRVARAAG